MATMEERIAVLEKEVAALKAKFSPEARLESGKMAFPGEAPKEDEAAIPNGILDPPKVSIAQAKKLAYVEFPDGRERWMDIRFSGKTPWGAEVLPYTEHDAEVLMKSCNKTIEPGTFKVGAYNKLPEGAAFLRKVRNPWLSVPAGCQAVEGEWELVEA